MDVCVGVPCPSYTNPTPTPVSTGKSDLVIESLTLDKDYSGPCPAYKYTVYVKNIGTSSANLSYLKTLVDPVQPQAVDFCTRFVPYSGSTASIPMNDLVPGDILPPGKSERYYDYFNPSVAGPVTITATADINDNVVEANENNNIQMKTFEVVAIIPTPTPTPIPNNPPTIITPNLPAATVGQSYSSSVDGTDRDLNDVLSMKLAIPTGYGLSAGPCAVTPGRISCGIYGTPTKASPSIPIGVSLTDGKATAGANLSLSISKFRPSPTPTPTPTPIPNISPTIVSSVFPAGFVGRSYYSSITATDPNLNDFLTASVSGLPPSLTVSGCTQFVTSVRNLTCTISGTPKSSGNFPVNITVTDSANASATKVINLYILKKYILF